MERNRKNIGRATRELWSSGKERSTRSVQQLKKPLKVKNTLKNPMLTKKELRKLNESFAIGDEDMMYESFFEAALGNDIWFQNYVTSFRDFYRTNPMSAYDMEKILCVFGLKMGI